MKLLNGGYMEKCSPVSDDYPIDSPEQSPQYRRNLPGPMHTPPRLRSKEIKNAKGIRNSMQFYENPSGLIHISQIEPRRECRNPLKRTLCLTFLFSVLICLTTLAYILDMRLRNFDTRIKDYLNEYGKTLVYDLQNKDRDISVMKEHVTKELGQIKQSVHRVVEELGDLKLGKNDPGGANILEQLYGEEPDYALEKNGGSVYSILGTQTYAPHSVTVTVYGISLWKHIPSPPRTVIKSLIHPGECWAFRGEGNIAIQLGRAVAVVSVTLEHIPKALTTAGNTDSAPRHFTVSGFETVDHFPDKRHHLGDFEYLRNGPPRQKFYTELKRREDDNPVTFQLVQFDFKTNHGNKIYTCVYRIRVHGVERNSTEDNNQIAF